MPSLGSVIVHRLRHGLLDIVFFEAMHQLTSRRRRFKAGVILLRSIDMKLIASSALLQQKYQKFTYHRRVELIQCLPLVLALFHDVDLVVLEWLTIPDLGENMFGFIAKGAIRTGEEGHSNALS